MSVVVEVLQCRCEDSRAIDVSERVPDLQNRRSVSWMHGNSWIGSRDKFPAVGIKSTLLFIKKRGANMTYFTDGRCVNWALECSIGLCIESGVSTGLISLIGKLQAESSRHQKL